MYQSIRHYGTEDLKCIFYNQRDATNTMFFIIISALYVPGGFFAHHRELIKLYVMLSCCLPLVWMGWNCSGQQKRMTIPEAAHTVL
jgi:hypothetical protein